MTPCMCNLGSINSAGRDAIACTPRSWTNKTVSHLQHLPARLMRVLNFKGKISWCGLERLHVLCILLQALPQSLQRHQTRSDSLLQFQLKLPSYWG